ncbi:hypothetical protein BDZ94DRAFT_1316627 [Collybia nuda]|uniref:Uncharacterized protein n=1 Tax=Collybia nuda TaxID=64659 RepID=A0A9P6C7S9_9AGAR|nr:hypothetical protein BDZ94DRAFT_1316627 [Collybia nuda]
MTNFTFINFTSDAPPNASNANKSTKMTPEQAAKNREKCKQYRAKKKAKTMCNKNQNGP